MLTYILIVLCLSLAGVAGLQMAYMFYLDRLDRERKKRLHEVEARCKDLAARLEAAEARIEEQDRLLATVYTVSDDGEVWADVIDDR
ncbi:MAG TPA: hypothetical protein VFZ49_03975 [Pyrinomonadaceae bacterium]